MNRTPGFPLAASSARLTWYGASSLTRSAHVSLPSPIDTHTSVCTKSTPATASAGSSVTVTRAPVLRAMSAANSATPAGGCRPAGPARRTSAPMRAPMTSSERPMLNRQSPT